MGKLFYLPCVDHYKEWNYEEYYANEEFEEQDYGNYGWNSEVLVKDGFVRGFVRKCLMFVLVRL